MHSVHTSPVTIIVNIFGFMGLRLEFQNDNRYKFHRIKSASRTVKAVLQCAALWHATYCGVRHLVAWYKLRQLGH